MTFFLTPSRCSWCFPDEFNVAVDAWNGGAVDNFNMASNNDWTYSLSSVCASLDNVGLPQSDAAEDLRAEVDERGTFGEYPRVTYFEDAPDTVLPTRGCTFNFAIFYQNSRVCHFLVSVGCHGDMPWNGIVTCLLFTLTGVQVGNVSTQAITTQTQSFSEICSRSSSSNTNRAIQQDLR